MITADSPILAAPRGTPEQAIRYIVQRFGDTTNYTPYDISNVIIPAYFEQAAPLGIEPVGAIAQAIHEGFPVSWWCARPRRNPAGLGVTGRIMVDKPAFGNWAYHDGIWEEGLSFDSWIDGSIPCHIGRLLRYALPKGAGTETQKKAMERALSYRPLHERFYGVAPIYRGLEGRWAIPGVGYATKIALIVQAIQNTRV